MSKSWELFYIPKGFYALESVLIPLTLLAQAPIASVEPLRYVPPEEWVSWPAGSHPEVCTLRQKIAELCACTPMSTQALPATAV